MTKHNNRELITMYRLFNILVISTLLVLTGCDKTTFVLSESALPADQPTPTTNVILTKTSTITPLPTITWQGFTVEPTDKPTVTPNPSINQNCLSIQPGLANDDQYSGKLIFESNFSILEHSIVIYDLRASEIITNILGGFNVSISPDSTRIAYHNPTTNRLEVLSSEGEQIESIPWNNSWGRIDRWLDNNNILVVLHERETPNSIYLKYPSTVSRVNPFTGEVENLLPDYPDIDKEIMLTSPPWYPASTTVYHPSLNRVVYPSPFDDGGIVLYDIPGQQKLATINAYNWRRHPPIWSPDGSKFILMGDDEFYLMTYDGIVSKITRMNTKDSSEIIKPKYQAEYYSWSPDNQYVAAWVYSSDFQQRTLALVDTLTGEITDYCISAGYDPRDVRIPPFPIWSPDGNNLVIAAHFRENGEQNDVILIDLVHQTAYEMMPDYFPLGWLKDPQ